MNENKYHYSNKDSYLTEQLVVGKMHKGSVYYIDWSENNETIISCSNDMQISIFPLPDLNNLDRIQFEKSDFKDDITTLEGHRNTIRMVKIFNHDRSIVTACDDSYLRI